MYTDKVMEHFRDPHNRGKLEEYSAIGKVGNIVCGDVMWLYIKVAPDADGQEIITDISWETFGCTAAIATSSMVSDLAKGRTLEEAIALTNQDVAGQLGGLPPVKMHCSALAADALNEAIYTYMHESGREIPEALQKRHERIEQEVATLEKRYAAFLSPKRKDSDSAIG
jgi:nitrogen fixation protein NifU and related proteins